LKEFGLPALAAAVFKEGVVISFGGCPYARGATGNLATEDLLYLLHVQVDVLHKPNSCFRSAGFGFSVEACTLYG
jgi:hypothetical protein